MYFPRNAYWGPRALQALIAHNGEASVFDAWEEAKIDARKDDENAYYSFTIALKKMCADQLVVRTYGEPGVRPSHHRYRITDLGREELKEFDEFRAEKV